MIYLLSRFKSATSPIICFPGILSATKVLGQCRFENEAQKSQTEL